ncbi:unnamed protein product [Thelazia callipaeda]|uniref:RNA binding protein n=1 Tax=Thelazia callipaeda TaxID=103827 RepID=A0A0N5CNP1_THECL|nr:unnamed protein product [Thelazia callipaeda]
MGKKEKTSKDDSSSSMMMNEWVRMKVKVRGKGKGENLPLCGCEETKLKRSNSSPTGGSSPKLANRTVTNLSQSTEPDQSSNNNTSPIRPVVPSIRPVVTTNGVERDPVRTLFVSGLPMDTKQRELHLLFVSCRGYENSLLRVSNSKDGGTVSPVGFVTFSTSENADQAMQNLQSVVFDPATGHRVRVEKAKSNTKAPRSRQFSPPSAAVLPSPAVVNSTPFPPSLLQAAAAAAAIGGSAAPQLPPPSAAVAAIAPQTFFQQPPSLPTSAAAAAVAAAAAAAHRHDLLNVTCFAETPSLSQFFTDNSFLFNSLPQFAAVSQPSLLLSPAAAAIAAGLPAVGTNNVNRCDISPASFLPSNAAAMAHLTAVASHQQQQPQQHVSSSQLNVNAMGVVVSSAFPTTSLACSTLFVANLGDNVNEEEIKAAFKVHPGFTRLRLLTRNDVTVAFVEFRDVRQATAAMNAMQGFRISSSGRSGIRIEYARNRMGEAGNQW